VENKTLFMRKLQVPIFHEGLFWCKISARTGHLITSFK